MDSVKAKKYLGQHFLKDESIARRIAESLSEDVGNVLEIGPGMGVLTKYVLEQKRPNFWVIEIDSESVEYLQTHYPDLSNRICFGDFLRIDLSTLFAAEKFAVIGNFPYNISSQILFKVFDNRNRIPEVVGAKPGSKIYGILSVLLSVYYDIEYLFTVSEHVFNPPPKVKSAVIRLKRNGVKRLECDEKLFVQVVKAGFNQRRKTLRNALKALNISLDNVPDSYLQARAEQLSSQDFVALTLILQNETIEIK